MLAVDIDQIARNLPQQRDSGGASIHPRLPAPVKRDLSLDQQRPVLVRRDAPLRKLRQYRRRELLKNRRDIGALRSRADEDVYKRQGLL